METNGNYELLYIVHPDLESSIDKSIDRVRSYIEKRDGKIIYEENWGKRKLAYPINKADVGIYVLWYFNAPKAKVASIEKDLRINEEVMRYMLLVAEEKKEAKPKVKKEIAEKAVEAKPVKKEAVKESKATEKERMKEIDEKLEALLAEDGEAKSKTAKTKK
jgi:small subunit ribosomal protein S6